MKLFSLAALALATGQCVLALPFPPEYHSSNRLHVRDTSDLDATAEVLQVRAKLGQLFKQGSGSSRPSHSNGSRPGYSGGSRPSSPVSHGVSTHSSGRRPARSSRPSSNHSSSKQHPLSEEAQEHERKAKHDADTLALKKEDFAETKKHNKLNRKIAMAAVGATGTMGLVTLGLGANTAIEAHNLNKFNQEHGSRRRRAVHEGLGDTPTLAARAKGYRVGRVKVRPNYNQNNNRPHTPHSPTGSHHSSHPTLEPSLSRKERIRKAQHDADGLELDRNKLAETKAHNERTRKIAMAAVGATGTMGAVTLGLGINTALETHRKNEYDMQKKLDAQNAAQNRRRAIIADDEYELYFVKVPLESAAHCGQL